ncbi:MAG TPA: hypothetical protein VIU61_14590 [Kofleriaceae bacterium]
MRQGVLVLLAACGRLGFGPSGDDSASGDGSMNGDGTTANGDGVVATTNANYVFLTSARVAPGALGGLAGADALCMAGAAQANIQGTYVAWLSTATINAIDRLGSARGWVRLDGLPFADTKADIAAGKIYYPASLDSTLADVIVKVPTGSGGMGQSLGTAHCGGWTTTAGTTTIGFSRGTSAAFSSQGSQMNCDVASPILCFGTDQDTAVTSPSTTAGKLIFIHPTWSSGSGVASADTLCTQVANTGGRPGTFRALLATSTMSLTARLGTIAGPIVRSDGVRVAASLADLLASNLEVAPNLRLDGTLHTTVNLYAGALTTSGTGGSNCLNWMDTTNTQVATQGDPRLAMTGWFGANAFGTMPFTTCNFTQAIYCLQL